MPGSQVVTLSNLYCVQGDIENILSIQGVKTRLDDDGDAYINTQEQSAMTDAIVEATETVNFYCFFKYAPEILVTSNWVNRQATLLASYAICRRRINPIPDVVLDDAEKAEERLKSIGDGPRLIPFLPLRQVLAPKWSNTRFLPQYQFRCLRVERQNSAQQNPTQLGQNVDFAEAYYFEL